MEKAQLPRKELPKENRKAAMEIPISGYLLLGRTGGVIPDPVKLSPGSGVYSQTPFVYQTLLGEHS